MRTQALHRFASVGIALWLGLSAPAMAGGNRGAASLAPEEQPVPWSVKIAFDEFPLGTAVGTQYRTAGIEFLGDAPVILADSPNPESPVLAPSADFSGGISARFVSVDEFGNVTPVARSGFVMDVGYLNSPNSVEIIGYDLDGNEIYRRTTRLKPGYQRLAISAPALHRWRAQPIESEPGGFAIDNLSYGIVGVSSTIGGCVAKGGRPEAGVLVRLRTLTARRRLEEATTDGDGCFEFDGVPRGYILTVVRAPS